MVLSPAHDLVTVLLLRPVARSAELKLCVGLQCDDVYTHVLLSVHVLCWTVCTSRCS
jgi:hypothetical protein